MLLLFIFLLYYTHVVYDNLVATEDVGPAHFALVEERRPQQLPKQPLISKVAEVL